MDCSSTNKMYMYIDVHLYVTPWELYLTFFSVFYTMVTIFLHNEAYHFFDIWGITLATLWKIYL